MQYSTYSGVTDIAFTTTGTGNVWNFSTVQSEFDGTERSGGAPIAGSPCEDTFTGADYMLYTINIPLDGDTNFAAVSHTGTQFSLTGEYSNDAQSTCALIDNPITYFQFPFLLGDGFTDIYSWDGISSYDFTVDYLAQGSLTLPGSVVYSDCALISFTQDTYVQYLFFAEVDGLPQTVFYLDDDGLFSIYSYEEIVGLKEVSDQSKVSLLNLENNTFQISGLATSSLVTISVFDNTGREILNQKNNFYIDLNDRAAGLYFLDIANDQHHEVIKVMVE